VGLESDTTATVATPPPRRRRRPSGEAPPLPRDLASGRWWLALACTGLVLWGLLGLVGATDTVLALDTQVDVLVLDLVELIRTPTLTDVAHALNALGSRWTLAGIAWATVLTTVAFKRWRQLFVLVLSLWVTSVITGLASPEFMRPRPPVERLGDWSGFAFPSLQVAALTTVLLGACYALLPAGRIRSAGKWVTAIVVASLALARLYLGVDHPTDVVVAFVVGWTVPLVAFRMLCPNPIFPVTYRRRRSAHLPIDARRLEAIRVALRDQLGVAVRSVTPFHLEESFGSTPLRIELDDVADTVRFAKLYAASHMRADRWYKLWRTLRYGRLEDERAYASVRRLVQHEDYLLRVMHDAGIPVARPLGFVTITPEREYLLVTEFVDGAVESTHATVDADVIDDGMAVVRRMWEAGVAHRDVKPANVMVRDGHVVLIDVAFGQVRPSPWREAVDLANMMLVLGLRSTPELVYERALRVFTADEIAEALASTSEATRPSLHRMLRADGRDLLAQFRRLAPPHPRVRVQRWSARRLGLTATTALGAVLAVTLLVNNFNLPGDLDDPIRTPTGRDNAALGPLDEDPLVPVCEGQGTGSVLLVAQAVPGASLVPCVVEPPAGWSMSGLDVHTGRAIVHFDSDRAGANAVVVVYSASCAVGGAVPVPSDESGTRRLEEVTSVAAGYRGTRTYLFDGGCVQYHFDIDVPGWSGLANEASVGLGFARRAAVARRYADLTDGLIGP
jgi:membrane-associated phospholipid phosphatase/tRNA A-37 threonylcarbamoyl transferase component Bud32